MKYSLSWQILTLNSETETSKTYLKNTKDNSYSIEEHLQNSAFVTYTPIHIQHRQGHQLSIFIIERANFFLKLCVFV